MFTFADNLNQNLIDEFNSPGPYYTSYPSLGKWTPTIQEEDYKQALLKFMPDVENEDTGLYIHFPYCPKLCYFCICNVSISKDREKINGFFHYLLREIDMLFKFFEKSGKKLRITDIHLGGGTPSYMTEEELTALVNRLKNWINMDELEEFSMEFDPRSATLSKLKLAKELGINRISMGIQDFKQEIQEAVNRVHSFEFIDSLLTPEVRSLFQGINFDVLYGLPLQTRDSFLETIDLVKKLSPDRVTLLRYAHVPDVNKHMKILDKYDMPDDQENAWFFFDAVDSFKKSGWEHIGIDHFAKSSDKLVSAKNKNALKRTFIGFQSGKLNNLLGIGPSSTLKLNDHYFQNICNLEDYVASISAGKFPIGNGYKMSNDDLIRREVIEKILCESRLNFEEIEKKYEIDFSFYFEEELLALDKYVKMKVATKNKYGLVLTDLGVGFKRQICKIFDKFYKIDQGYKIHGTGNKRTRLTL